MAGSPASWWAWIMTGLEHCADSTYVFNSPRSLLSSHSARILFSFSCMTAAFASWSLSTPCMKFWQQKRDAAVNTTSVNSLRWCICLRATYRTRCMQVSTISIAVAERVTGRLRQARAYQVPIPRGKGPIARPPTDPVLRPTLPAFLKNPPQGSQALQSRHPPLQAVPGTGHHWVGRNSTRDRDRILRRSPHRTTRRKHNSQSGMTLRNTVLLDRASRDTRHPHRIHHDTIHTMHDTMHEIRPRVLRGCHPALRVRLRVRPLRTKPGTRIR